MRYRIQAATDGGFEVHVIGSQSKDAEANMIIEGFATHEDAAAFIRALLVDFSKAAKPQN